MQENENKAFTDLVDIVYLNSENAKFYRTPAGFAAAELYIKKIVKDDLAAQDETADAELLWQDVGRVYFHRAFPFDAPDEFISVLDKEQKEYGIIKNLSDLGEEARKIVTESLDRKYFAPEIKKILNIKERFGYSYWDVETDHGNMSFTLQDTFRSIVRISETRLFINDIDGNRFNIADIEALDHASYRRIELYL